MSKIIDDILTIIEAEKPTVPEIGQPLADAYNDGVRQACEHIRYRVIKYAEENQ